ncbi:MAG: endolytic transglycosylase MltG [Candidatus Ozemobacteraceae bacterium]
MTSFLLGGYWWLADASSCPLTGRPVSLVIAPGMHTGEIAALLKGNGILKSAFLFRFWVGFYGVGNRLRPGNYKFQGNESLDQILQLLLEGREERVRVTIPEGWTVPMVAAGVERAGICSASTFIETISSPELLQRTFPGWGALSTPEGLAFPETYTFSRGVSPKDVVESMLQKTFEVVSRRVGTATAEGLTPYQACILASIVEREGKLSEERPVISSVFLNRLRQGMRLESCATVQFALPQHKERLTFDDLKFESPFNTYLHPGLPPAPISNFGKMSIDAVVSPAKTEFLFFVSDASAGHRFAATLSEHERYRKRFFQDRQNDQSRGLNPPLPLPGTPPEKDAAEKKNGKDRSSNKMSTASSSIVESDEELLLSESPATKQSSVPGKKTEKKRKRGGRNR